MEEAREVEPEGESSGTSSSRLPSPRMGFHWCRRSMGECAARPSAAARAAELPGLDALLRDGGGVTVERGEEGEERDEMEEPLADRRRIADAVDRRRPRVDDARSEEPRMR